MPIPTAAEIASRNNQLRLSKQEMLGLLKIAIAEADVKAIYTYENKVAAMDAELTNLATAVWTFNTPVGGGPWPTASNNNLGF